MLAERMLESNPKLIDAAVELHQREAMSRAYTVAVSGVQSGRPMIEGIFDHAATMLDEHLVPLPLEAARERIDQAVERATAMVGAEPV